MNQLVKYVGLDVHKETIAVAVAEGGKRSEVREHGDIVNTPAAMTKLLGKFGGPGVELHICYEAGPCGYVSPPAHAIVLSVDEKSHIQALDRTQPELPLKRGRGATMTQNYKRNGTTTLFAALNVLDGSVIGVNHASSSASGVSSAS